MPGIADALATLPPPDIDPASIAAAQAQVEAFQNPPPIAAPNPFVTPEEAARAGFVVPGAVALPAAQQAAAAFQAPPPPVATAPLPVAAPPVMAPPAAPVSAPTRHAAGPGLQPPPVAEDVAAIRQASQATQGAIVQQGEAQAAGDTAEAEARALGGERMAAQQEHRAEVQRQRDQAVSAINADQQRVYDEAHRATIPDFFEGRPGTRAMAAVSMALGEAGKGLLAFGTGANVGNTAKDIIDRNIATYYQRKKEETDNLFKYAAARNTLGEQEKQLWATKLNDLQFEMAATHQAMADHILEQAAASKGRIAQAQAQVLAKQQAESAVALEQKARETNFNNQISTKRLGIEYYNAQSERIRALKDKEAQVEIKINGAIDSDMQRLQTRLEKPKVALSKINDIIESMDDAYNNHDPNKLAAAIVAFKEGVGPLFAGGKTTGNLTKQIEGLGTTKDEIVKGLGKLTGGNTVGDTLYHRMREMAVLGANDQASLIGKDRQGTMNKYLGPGGIANTPAAKQRFLNDLNGITSTVTMGGKPLFEEGGATPSSQPYAAPAAPNTVVKLKDGTTAEFDASGRRVK